MLNISSLDRWWSAEIFKCAYSPVVNSVIYSFNMLVNKLFVFSFVIVMIPQVFCKAPSESIIDGRRIKSPQSDFVFKKIFSNEHLLLSFINSALNRGSEHKPVFTRVKYLDTSLSPEIPINKQVYLDLVCETESKEQIIVEIQVRRELYFLKRAAYYVGRLYSEQLLKPSEMIKIADGKKEKAANNLKAETISPKSADNVETPILPEGKTKNDNVYRQMKPVFFIAICDFILFENKKDYISTHIIKDEKTNENDMKEFSWTFIELPKLINIDAATLTTDVEKFSYLFLFDAKNQQYIQGLELLSKTNRIIKDALDIANVGSWSIAEQQAWQRAEDIINRFDSELAAAEDLGKEKQRIETAKIMLKKKHSSKLIAEILGMKEDEVTKLKIKLKKEGKNLPSELHDYNNKGEIKNKKKKEMHDDELHTCTKINLKRRIITIQ